MFSISFFSSFFLCLINQMAFYSCIYCSNPYCPESRDPARVSHKLTTAAEDTSSLREKRTKSSPKKSYDPRTHNTRPFFYLPGTSELQRQIHYPVMGKPHRGTCSMEIVSSCRQHELNFPETDIEPKTVKRMIYTFSV